jgi:hypothetical protein
MDRGEESLLCDAACYASLSLVFLFYRDNTKKMVEKSPDFPIAANDKNLLSSPFQMFFVFTI